MPMPTVRFPIVCPVCKGETLLDCPVAEVAEGLLTGSLELSGRCGHATWRATDVEREQIREYLASPILDQQLDVTRMERP